MVKWMVVLMGLVMLPLSAQAVACGPDTDCVIGDRTYRIRMPEGHDGVTPVGAIVFVHGYRGTAAGVMRNKSLMKVASDLGVALIAVTSVGGDWSVAIVRGADGIHWSTPTGLPTDGGRHPVKAARRIVGLIG